MLVIDEILVEWPGARVCEDKLFDPVKPDVGDYSFDPPVLPTKEEVDAWKNKIESDRARYWEFYMAYARRVRGWKIRKRGSHVIRETFNRVEKVEKGVALQKGLVPALRKSSK